MTQTIDKTKKIMENYFIYNDGGRVKAGYKGDTRDCVTRAIAIATDKSYQEIYDEINKQGRLEKITKRKKGKSNARSGVYKCTASKVMEKYGWEWTPTMRIGSGCQLHLDPDELPQGRIVARVSKHYVAVIDGVLHDTDDECHRGGTRCVYGYYKKGGDKNDN